MQGQTDTHDPSERDRGKREEDRYYLSWGCFYAVGSSPFGPFTYVGSFIDAEQLANTSFASGGGTEDRHGSFFEFHRQTYFVCGWAISLNFFQNSCPDFI